MFVSTTAPTDVPIGSDMSPVSSPISAPVATPDQVDDSSASCVASISTDRTCYENGDNIVVTFTNCDESPTNWIGVWQSSQPTADTLLEGDPLSWVYACGDQVCTEASAGGEAIFYNARGGGSFRMFLVRSDQLPFTAYATSNEFRLEQTCSQ
jgi:hypothetical protein